jgi:acetyl esterase/lipase
VRAGWSAAIAALLLAGAAGADEPMIEPRCNVARRADISYVEGSADPKQALDLYVPYLKPEDDAGEASPWPVALFVHGGVWAMGDRADFANVGEALASHGILTAVMSYRLAPAAKHPAQIEDVASAVAWLAAHAVEHGGEGGIHLIGHSAGAHLVELLALDGRWLAAHGLRLGQIASLVGLSGIYDLEQPFGDPGQDTGREYVERVFGPLGDTWREASPVRHLGAPGPGRVLLVMAEHDYTGIRAQTRMFDAAMRKAGGHPRITEIAGRDHYDLVGQIGTAGDPTTEPIARFVLGLRS